MPSDTATNKALLGLRTPERHETVWRQWEQGQGLTTPRSYDVIEVAAGGYAEQAGLNRLDEALEFVAYVAAKGRPWALFASVGRRDYPIAADVPGVTRGRVVIPPLACERGQCWMVDTGLLFLPVKNRSAAGYKLVQFAKE